MRIDQPEILGGSLPNWTLAGTIQSVGVGGSTTAPTVPTNHIVNSILYKQIGPKTHMVRGIYQSAGSTTGGAAGSGEYLFTLPYGLQFDSNVVGQAFHTTTGNDSTSVVRAIPSSNVVIGQIGGTFAAGWPTGIIPWDATRYRIGAFLVGSSTYCWQSGYFAMTSGNLNVRWEFTFQSL